MLPEPAWRNAATQTLCAARRCPDDESCPPAGYAGAHGIDSATHHSNPRTKTTYLAGQDTRAPPASRRLQRMACLLPGRRLPLQRLATGSRKQRYRARLH